MTTSQEALRKTTKNPTMMTPPLRGTPRTTPPPPEDEDLESGPGHGHSDEEVVQGVDYITGGTLEGDQKPDHVVGGAQWGAQEPGPPKGGE